MAKARQIKSRKAAKPKSAPAGPSASERIGARIAELGGWRGDALARVRKVVRAADRRIVEEWKWGVPVWSCGGIVCTGEAYKNAVKLTFARGASLEDPAGLFNASLDGRVRRAIDLHEGDEIDAAALKALVRAAIQANEASARELPAAAKEKPAAAEGPRLLAGGNPQIAKGEGDASVQAYIAATPGWKRDVGRRIDALIVRAVPGVRKAVKWNSPLYGVAGRGWFLGVHCFAKYVKVAFFRGAQLRPPPPGPSKQKHVRYLDIREDDAIDEAQFVDWAKQASELPGERM